MEARPRRIDVTSGDTAADGPAAPLNEQPGSLEHALDEAKPGQGQGQGRAPKRGRPAPCGSGGTAGQPLPPPSSLSGVTAAVTSEILMSDSRANTVRANSSGNSDDTTARRTGSSSSPTSAGEMPAPLSAQLSVDVPAAAPQQPQPAIEPIAVTPATSLAQQQVAAVPMQQDGGSGLVAVKQELPSSLPPQQLPPITAATQQEPGSNGGSTSLSRRVLANRQSAARSKERRRGYVIGLEQSVKRLTQQINEQQAHLHSLASNSATLGTANFALSQHATGLEEQLRNHETAMSELRQECERLRHSALQSPSSSQFPLEVPSTSLAISGTSMAESQGAGQPTSGEVQSAQPPQESHQEWEQYMSWGSEQHPAAGPTTDAPAVPAQDTPMADAATAAMSMQQAQANGGSAIPRVPSIQTGGDAVWQSSSWGGVPVPGSSIQTGEHSVAVISDPGMLRPGSAALAQMPWCGASAVDPGAPGVTSLLPPSSPGMPPLPVHWPPGYDSAAAVASAQAATAAAASQPASMSVGSGSAPEVDRLVAQYAAAPPPGVRLAQPGRVHDPGCLRLASAPAGMQIRIAGAGAPNARATAPQPPHTHGPPPQLPQQPEERHHRAAPAQQPLQQQPPVGGHSIMQQATMQEALPQKVSSVDLDQMADIFNTFDANDDMFPGLGRPQ